MMRLGITSRLILVQELILVMFVAVVSWHLFVTVTGIYENQERHAALEDLDRVRLALSERVQDLQRLARDYASWDDTYAFAADQNKEFIQSNLDDAMFRSNNINLLYIVDPAGRPVWGKALDGVRRLTLAEFTFAPLVPDHPLMRAAAGPDAGVAGLMMTSQGPAMLAGQPVTTSLYQGPVRGILAMGRFLDETEWAEIARRTRITLSTTALDALPVNPQADHHQAGIHTRLMAGERIIIDDSSPQTLHLDTLLRDLSGNPLMVLHVDVSRQFTATGSLTLRLTLVTMLLAGGFVIFASWIAVRRMVTAPLTRITRQLRTLNDGSGTAVLKAAPDTEIGALTAEINRLIARLPPGGTAG